MKKRFFVELTVEDDVLRDSPYWSIAARGRDDVREAMQDLLLAEVTRAVEAIPSIIQSDVKEAYD